MLTIWWFDSLVSSAKDCDTATTYICEEGGSVALYCNSDDVIIPACHCLYSIANDSFKAAVRKMGFSQQEASVLIQCPLRTFESWCAEEVHSKDYTINLALYALFIEWLSRAEQEAAINAANEN